MDSPLLARVSFAFGGISELCSCSSTDIDLVVELSGEKPEAWAPRAISSRGAFSVMPVSAPMETWAGTKTKKRQSLTGKTQDTKTPLFSVMDVK